MAEWGKLALIFTFLGFELDALLAVGNGTYSGSRNAVEAMLIIGFLLFLSASILMLLINIGELGGNKIAEIVATVLLFLTGLFLLIGIAVYGSNNNRNRAYSTTMYCVAMFMSIAAGIFMLLQLLGIGGGGGSRTSPSK